MRRGYEAVELTRRSVLPATILLLALGYLDMAYTLVAVHMGWAHEANPLMASMLNRSDAMFVIVKLGSLIVPLSILEAMRGRYPVLIAQAMRIGAVAYVAWYGVASIAVHTLHI